MLFILHLIWASWNVAHIAHHEVSPNEVEDVCHSDPLVQEGKKNRLLIIGITKDKRMLSIILDHEEEEGIYYPVTARTASKKERKLYKQEKEVQEK